MLQGIFARAPADVVAVGNGGTVVRFGADLPTRPGGPCARPVPISCGATVTGSNASRPGLISSYGCTTRPLAGGEVFYRFDSPVTGRATVRLAPHRADLDLVVMGTVPSGACDPVASCPAASQAAGTAPEQMTFTVAAGGTYYLAVDGDAGVVSGYTLSLDCEKQ